MRTSRKVTDLHRAIIVMASDPLKPTGAEIAASLGCSEVTVWRVCKANKLERRTGSPFRPGKIFRDQVTILGRLIRRGKLYEVGEIVALSRVMRLAWAASLNREDGRTAAAVSRSIGQAIKDLGFNPALSANDLRKWQAAWRGGEFGNVLLDCDHWAAALFWWSVGSWKSWVDDATPLNWPDLARLMLLLEAPDRTWITIEEGQQAESRLTPAQVIAARKRYESGVQRRLRALCDDPETADAAKTVMRWGGLSSRP